MVQASSFAKIKTGYRHRRTQTGLEKMVKATDGKKDRYGSEDIFYQQRLKIMGRTKKNERPSSHG
jgi:hypothetical protein